jgi:hypothetical protein
MPCNDCSSHTLAARAGGYPTTVFHSTAPAGTVKLLWQLQSQSVSAIILHARQRPRSKRQSIKRTSACPRRTCSARTGRSCPPHSCRRT